MTTPRVGRTRGRWLRRAGLALVALAGIGVLVATVLVLFGLVTGEEFCPQTFQRRRFWLVEVPLLHWPLLGERREDSTRLAEVELGKRGWIATLPSATTEWHLAWQRRDGRRQTGDALLLWSYLDSRDEEGELRWLAWSEDHPDLARRLWPAVQQLAVRGQYLAIPDLFLLARQHSDPTRFEEALSSLLGSLAAEGAPPGDARPALPGH
jgi:hypothetical protein